MKLVGLIQLGLNALDVIILTHIPYSWQTKVNQRRFKKIVRYAQKNSPYYHDIIPENWTDPGEIPLSTKQDIMKNFDRVLTDRRLTLNSVREHKEKNPSGCKIFGKYSISVTSGSTGHPIICVQDNTMTHRQFTSLINYCYFPCATICVPGYGVMNTNHDSNSRSSSFIGAISRTFSCYLPQEELADALNKCRPGALMTYGSMLETLTDMSEQGMLRIRPKIIMSSGSAISPGGRDRLQRAFPKSWISSTYACTEGGVLAVECKCGHLHIREDLVRVEPLDAEGKPVADDVVSDKVAVTSYFNFVQPVVRYIIEDRVRIHHGCKCGNHAPWVEVEGRAGGQWSFYTADGDIKKVPTFNLLCLMEEASDRAYRYYSGYQLVLHEGRKNRIEFRLNYYPNTDKAEVKEEIARRFNEYFSSIGIEIEMEMADIPPQITTSTGKVITFLVVKEDTDAD